MMPTGYLESPMFPLVCIVGIVVALGLSYFLTRFDLRAKLYWVEDYTALYVELASWDKKLSSIELKWEDDFITMEDAWRGKWGEGNQPEELRPRGIRRFLDGDPRMIFCFKPEEIPAAARELTVTGYDKSGNLIRFGKQSIPPSPKPDIEFEDGGYLRIIR